MAHSTGTPSVQTDSSKPGDGHVILVVDDDPAVRRLVTAVLERLGHAVVAAENTDSAIRAWEAHPGCIRLLITDVALSEGSNGVDLARALRERDPLLKVILSSGRSVEVIGRALENRADTEFLQKPYSMAELAAAISRVLESN